jgi:hypothetical protein
LGGWGEIEIKAKLSPAKAGAWAELGNNNVIRSVLIVDKNLVIFFYDLKL